MKLSDLFPSPEQSGTTITTTADTTPPRIVLLDQPIAKVSGGNMSIKIRTLLIDEESANVSAPSTLPNRMTFVKRSPPSISTLGEEPVKIQVRIE